MDDIQGGLVTETIIGDPRIARRTEVIFDDESNILGVAYPRY